jgi:hypothetical protein
MRLTESVLKFVVESVVAERREHPHLIELLRWTAAVFEVLAQKFNLERAALNTLSDCYLGPLRERWPVGDS